MRGRPTSIAPDAPPPELPPIETAITIASGYANRSTVEMRQKSEALKSVMASVRGIDARKVLVLLTQSLETNPGEYPFMFLDALRDEFNGRFSPMSEARRKRAALAPKLGTGPVRVRRWKTF